MKKQSWKEYLHFSRKERNALVIICAVIIATIFIPYLIPAKQAKVTVDTTLQQQLDAISLPADSTPKFTERSRNNTAYNQKPDANAISTTPAELFTFDPNTLDAAGWKRLGLRDKTISMILNYRSKGGHFRKPEDLARIYGLRPEESARLIPYVNMAETKQERPAYQNKEQIIAEQKVIPPPPARKQYRQLNVNTATEEEWKSMPGIGDVLAGRIVNFRSKIGGFKSIEQVGKTYGLKDSVFQEMKPYLRLE